MNRLALRVGENLLTIASLWAAIEAYHWGSIGLQMWRERKK